MKREDFIEASKELSGSRDLGTQLFCALLRAIGVTTRLVCSLQPLPFSFASKVQVPVLPPEQGEESDDEPELVDAPKATPEASTSSMPTLGIRSRSSLRRPGFRAPVLAPAAPPKKKRSVPKNKHSESAMAPHLKAYIRTDTPGQKRLKSRSPITQYTGSRHGMKPPRSGYPWTHL